MAKIAESELILNKDGSVYHLSLRPEDITDTILLVGDPGRVHNVSKHFDQIDFEMNKREFITHVGTHKGKRLMVMSTGMGVSNIEIAMLELDALANIDLKTREPNAKKRILNIIRIGTSGAIQEDIEVGSFLVSEYAVGMDNILAFYDLPQDDFEASFSSELKNYLNLDLMPYTVQSSSKLFNMMKSDMIAGFTATTPGFYAPQGRQLRLPIRHPEMVDKLTTFHYEDHWITNFEMETSGLYAFGKMLGHEMLSTNVILANRAKGLFSKNPSRSIDQLIQKVLELV
jgi:uridine phosphorylase